MAVLPAIPQHPPPKMKLTRLFRKACAEYSLLQDGDKVLVALSGGKDSLMLVKLLGEQQRIHKPRITVEAVHVIMDNIPYETDRSYIQQFCQQLKVPLTILHSSFDDTTANQTTAQPHNHPTAQSHNHPTAQPHNPPTAKPHNHPTAQPQNRKPKCFLCSWNRRKTIFQYAEANGFTKVALGHHQDDILTTLLMNMTFEGSIQTMPPMLPMEHYPFAIIRPMCLIPEHLITAKARELQFEKQKTLCPYDTVTRRAAMADIFHTLEKMNPEARYSLWHSMTNIVPNLLPPK